MSNAKWNSEILKLTDSEAVLISINIPEETLLKFLGLKIKVPKHFFCQAISITLSYQFYTSIDFFGILVFFFYTSLSESEEIPIHLSSCTEIGCSKLWGQACHLSSTALALKSKWSAVLVWNQVQIQKLGSIYNLQIHSLKMVNSQLLFL